jgi:predicted TPR repeat methyltransferase
MNRLNPWLQIPAEDYEGHMSSNNVGQLKVLSEIFRKGVSEYNPESIMLLGCATGNGLEHLKGVETVVGVDVNPEYIEKCRSRFIMKLPRLNLICADIDTFDYQAESFDLIHAALIFEYLEVESLLKKAFGWLNRGGYLSAVLQLESKVTSAISETGFSSLKILQPIHKLVDPNIFVNRCTEIGFREIKNYEVLLPGEKKFIVILFQKCV